MRLHIGAVGGFMGWEVTVQGPECHLKGGAPMALVPIRISILRHPTLEEASHRILMILTW
jgi:hypothetical protein